MAVLILALLLGGPRFIWNRAFAQNVVASIIVLPISLAIGVLLGVFLHKYSLRFQARHAGNALRDAVSLAVWGFVLFLRNECGFIIDLEGPVDHRLVMKARRAVHSASQASCWSSARLPPSFEQQTYRVVTAISACFKESTELRLAFPRALDLVSRHA